MPLRRSNVDTDQIIPKQFLKRIERAGYGEFLFFDWMKDEAFELHRYPGASILVGGRNFGCGSSREHAPWALYDYGFRAVISTSIADIFKNNSLKNGLLPIVVDAAAHAKLLAAPNADVTVSLEAQTVTLPDGSTAKFSVDPFSRYCLLNGIDELKFLLSQDAEIRKFEDSRR